MVDKSRCLTGDGRPQARPLTTEEHTQEGHQETSNITHYFIFSKNFFRQPKKHKKKITMSLKFITSNNI